MKGHKNGHGRKGHEVAKDHGDRFKDGFAGSRRGQPKTYGKPRSSLGKGVHACDKNED